jgi:hypothetical protein
MKTPNSIFLTLPATASAVVKASIAAVLAISACGSLQAQGLDPWVTVDKLQYVGGLPANSSDIGSDPDGNIYAAGSGTASVDGTLRAALVQKSSDQGASWTTVDELSTPEWNWAHYRAMTSDPNSGKLFVGGNGFLASQPSTNLAWIVRESADHGNTWTTADNPFPFPGDTYAGCADIKVSPSGDVYASGSSLNYGEVIRKRAAGATNFTTVFSAGPTDIGSCWAMAFHPTRGVFTSCNKVTASIPVWIVRRSPSGNLGTWTTVDTFHTSTEWTQGWARDIVVAPSGAIYVSGWAYSAKTRLKTWIVRSSFDGGVTWAISDNFTDARGAEGAGIALDGKGNIFVVGQAQNSSGAFYWLVRKGTPVTKSVKKGTKTVEVTTVTWVNSDVFQLANVTAAVSPYPLFNRDNGAGAMALHINCDKSGNMYVCGNALDASGVSNWIVRKLAP